MIGENSAKTNLSALRAANADVLAAVLVTMDGFPVAADVAPEVDEEGLAALAADLIGRAGRSSQEFGNGALNELYAKGPQGYLIIMTVGSDQALACLAKSSATIGLLLRDVRKAACALA
jgi:predicted regulator of Ras-like GTPase activity (Roadblock/LC7/MglB family)